MNSTCQQQRQQCRRSARTPEMACNVIALGAGRAAVSPLAGQTEVVGALATDVVVAEVIIEGLWVRGDPRAALPLTSVAVRSGGWGGRVSGVWMGRVIVGRVRESNGGHGDGRKQKVSLARIDGDEYHLYRQGKLIHH